VFTGSFTSLRYNWQKFLRNVALLAGKYSTGALLVIIVYWKACVIGKIVGRTSEQSIYLTFAGTHTADRLLYTATKVVDANNMNLNCNNVICLNDQDSLSILYKNLRYRQRTARCVVSVEILPIATQQCRNYLYDKSWTKYQLSLIDPCDKIVL